MSKLDKYRAALLAKEQELLSGLQRTGVGAREQPDEGGMDEADQSVFSESKEALLTEAQMDIDLLAEVRAALLRIEEGSYGKCLEDDKEIEAARLNAVPWASYCVKHQTEREGGGQQSLPTL